MSRGRSSILKNIDLRLDLKPDLPRIEADAGQMQQLIMNLVINAAETIPGEQPGIVLVRTSLQSVGKLSVGMQPAGQELAPGDYVVLEVHDTGIGMDEATQAKIFEPASLSLLKGSRPKGPESLSGSRQAIINHAFPKPDPGCPGLPHIRRWRPCPNHVGARRSGAVAGPHRADGPNTPRRLVLLADEGAGGANGGQSWGMGLPLRPVNTPVTEVATLGNVFGISAAHAGSATAVRSSTLRPKAAGWIRRGDHQSQSHAATGQREERLNACAGETPSPA